MRRGSVYGVCHIPGGGFYGHFLLSCEVYPWQGEDKKKRGLVSILGWDVLCCSACIGLSYVVLHQS